MSWQVYVLEMDMLTETVVGEAPSYGEALILRNRWLASYNKTRSSDYWIAYIDLRPLPRVLEAA